MIVDIKGKWALITGASSGFGKDFATALAAQGANLVLSARSVEPMEELASTLRGQYGHEVIIEISDLASPGASAALKQKLDAKGLAIEILIANAGVGIYGSFLDQSVEKTTSMLSPNVVAVTEMAALFGAEMARRRSGYILLLASLAAYQPTPLYAAYAASKAYVLNFGIALHTELEHSGVTVTVLAPSVTDTGFLKAAGQQTNPFIRLLLMKPRPVVERGLQALWKGRSSVIAGNANRILSAGTRFMTRGLQSAVAYRTMK